ncbi:PAS domain S-box protein [Solibacillus sp. CAU 1738]|uniref:two-component system sensor histidine kinase NtrB n=1 Tax=Solibacillus sp. CAU 1738 TaxID=3140363 RepID=UPI003260DA4D
MQQLETLHKRNLFVFYSLLISLTIHMTAIAIGIYEYLYYYPMFAITIVIFIGAFFYFKVHPQKIQLILMVGWNVVIVFIVTQSSQIFSLYWFLYYLLLMCIYRSLKVNITLTLLTTIEVALILSWLYKHGAISGNVTTETYLLFLLLSCCLFLMQTLYIKQLWEHIEKRILDKEHELSSTEAYLKLFFENADDAIAVFDLDNKIIEVNPSFEKLYGWTREECIGNILPLVPPENFDVMQQRLQKILRGERFHLIETQDMRKDGTLFDAQISLAPIYNSYGEMLAVSVISRDNSYIKENEKLIIQSEKLKLAGEIAAGVAHEIRNPMTVISGFVQIMNEDKDSPYHPYTEIIKSEIERIDLIISEFLVLSKPQADTKEIIDVQNILNDIGLFFQIEFENRNIEYYTKINTVNPFILGNRNQIKQVFINIMKNAIEAIQHDGKITLDIYDDKQNVYFAICDDGIGISDYLVERIFEPFYTTKSTGTGLGMMITNKIVQEHNGFIKIRSKENVGTQIIISFPIIEK